MISSTRVAFMLSGCVFSSGAIAASWSLYFGMLIGAPPTRVFENGRMEALHMWLLPVGVLATIVTAVHVALLLVASPSGGCQPCDRACKGAVTVALFCTSGFMLLLCPMLSGAAVTAFNVSTGEDNTDFLEAGKLAAVHCCEPGNSCWTQPIKLFSRGLPDSCDDSELFAAGIAVACPRMLQVGAPFLFCGGVMSAAIAALTLNLLSKRSKFVAALAGRTNVMKKRR